MSITTPAVPGSESSLTQTHSSRALINDDRLMDLRFRNPNSSQHLVALPWEDAE